LNRLWPVLLPELHAFPREERDSALKAARATPLDAVELLGMAAALMAVTALTRYVLPDMAMATRFAAVLLNFAVALPLLALTFGPFHVRRLRRGLREQLRKRGAR
jgi:hypothetical protein